MLMNPNRIDLRFQQCRSERRPALILYTTAGFPDLETTARLLPALEAAGADIIELGVPFSDPIADGPTIQKASAKALDAGTTLPGILELLGTLRARGFQIPVVLFGAFNPFLHYGLDALARDAAHAGADGFLAADLPIEEAAEFRRCLDPLGLHLIDLAAPTTPEERLRRITDHARGFLYCIALKGVTGARSTLGGDVGDYLDRVRRCVAGKVPVALGFGISGPEQIRSLRGQCDAVVVGSALIQAIEQAAAATPPRDPVEAAAEFTRSLVAALRPE
jgi:tryptophan synthase alpha chain